MTKPTYRSAILIGCIAFISLFFQNCGFGSFSATLADGPQVLNSTSNDGSSDTNSDSATADKTNISSFHFFHGGWFPAPNQPNWSDDIQFVLKDGVLSADSKTNDELCTKPLYVVQDQDRVAILNLIAGLKIVVAQNIQPIADSGVKKITLKMKDNSEKVIFLQEAGANNGDNVATNGAELGDYLQNLNKKIPVACENAEDLVSFTYFKGGGYPAPGMPSWSNDMKFRITSGGVLVKSQVHDTLCSKPEFTLSQADAMAIIAAASQLNIITKTESPVVADAPTDKVTMTLKSGEQKVVHLNNHSAAVGDLLATNGASFAQLLQELDKKIPMACQ